MITVNDLTVHFDDDLTEPRTFTPLDVVLYKPEFYLPCRAEDIEFDRISLPLYDISMSVSGHKLNDYLKNAVNIINFCMDTFDVMRLPFHENYIFLFGDVSDDKRLEIEQYNKEYKAYAFDKDIIIHVKEWLENNGFGNGMSIKPCDIPDDLKMEFKLKFL